MMKCENCTKYDDCRTGSGLTWPCGAYRPKTGGGMDIENLIADLQEISQKNSISHYKRDRCAKAATALATFQAENEKLRAELEQIPSCIYYKQGGLCRYGGDDPANVCVLGPCDHDVSVQDVLTKLEQVKAERDAAIDCINQIQSARDHTRPAYVVDSILHNWKSRK